MDALERALAAHRSEIHHPDQGIHYAARGYAERPKGLGVRISMAGRGQAVENPYAERVTRLSKRRRWSGQRLWRLSDRSFLEDVYWTKRIHSAWGYRTPAEFEAAYWAEQNVASAGVGCLG